MPRQLRQQSLTLRQKKMTNLLGTQFILKLDVLASRILNGRKVVLILSGETRSPQPHHPPGIGRPGGTTSPNCTNTAQAHATLETST